MNTPAQGAEAVDTVKDTADDQKEGQLVVPDITAEEEEWLRKLRESQFPWYPWPSIDKIRMGNLQKLMYHREKGDDLDRFDVKAHYAARTAQDLTTQAPASEVQNEILPSETLPHAPARLHAAPREPRKDFSLFDDVDG